MKKLVFATAMALAAICLAHAPQVPAQAPAQDAGQVSLPADQYNAYQNASTQSDPAARAAALESFLQAYPQTPVKKTVLDQLIDAYQQARNVPKALDAATRLLQIDPNNMKAIYMSVYIDTSDCKKAVDPQTGDLKDAQPCDNAAILAQKGLGATKPAETDPATWKTITGAAYPVFDSAIALDDVLSKKDYAAAVDEYTKELMLYPVEQTQAGPGLVDTLNLAEALVKPSPQKDLVKAVWFYARAFDFAPAPYKPQIEPKLDYWYKRYHGTLDGDAAIKTQLDAIKAQAQSSLFPPSSFTIAPAPTPAELAHHAYTNGDPKLLSLEDKEYILANGSNDDANGLWALLKGQQTPVPGVLISAQATALKVTVTMAASAKPKDYVVKLTTPADCEKVPEAPSELKVKDVQAYVLANGVKADTDPIDALTDSPAKIKKIEVAPAVAAIDVAVTQDAKDSKTADFIVDMKEPASCNDVPPTGLTLGIQPAAELDATYSTFTKIPAANGRDASAQIELSDGFLQAEKKAPVHAKPSPAHHAAGAHHTGE
ncbi:MAG: tetratricopeptide repeat protein [Terracidiphilus sp.]